MSMTSFPAAWTASTWRSPPCACTSTRDLGDRLDHAGLVIGELDRDQNRPSPAFSRRAASQGRSIKPSALHRDQLDVFGVKPMTVEAAGMLGRSQEQHRRAAAAQTAERRAEDQVGGLGAAAGEDHVLGLRADQPGDLIAGVLDGGARGAALRMDGGRIPRQPERARSSPPSPRAAAARWRCGPDKRARRRPCGARTPRMT